METADERDGGSCGDEASGVVPSFCPGTKGDSCINSQANVKGETRQRKMSLSLHAHQLPAQTAAWGLINIWVENSRDKCGLETETWESSALSWKGKPQDLLKR